MWSTKTTCPYCQEVIRVDKFDLVVVCTSRKRQNVEALCPLCFRPFTLKNIPASVTIGMTCEEETAPFTLIEILIFLAIFILLLIMLV